MAADYAFDRTDIAIIDELQKNARITNQELASRVNLAPSSCHARVRALRDAGVFSGFHAALRPEAAGIGLHAITQVRLRHHTRDVVDRFRDHCLDLPEVVALFHLSGATDFLVQLALRDAEHLRDFLMDAFTTWDEIDHLETSMVFERVVKATMPIWQEPGR